jgi:hypothetical protein
MARLQQCAGIVVGLGRTWFWTHRLVRSPLIRKDSSRLEHVPPWIHQTTPNNQAKYTWNMGSSSLSPRRPPASVMPTWFHWFQAHLAVLLFHWHEIIFSLRGSIFRRRARAQTFPGIWISRACVPIHVTCFGLICQLGYINRWKSSWLSDVGLKFLVRRCSRRDSGTRERPGHGKEKGTKTVLNSSVCSNVKRTCSLYLIHKAWKRRIYMT